MPIERRDREPDRVVLLQHPGQPAGRQILDDDEAGRGLVEILALPGAADRGPFGVLAFGTARPGGFAPAERDWLEHEAPARRAGSMR